MSLDLEIHHMQREAQLVAREYGRQVYLTAGPDESAFTRDKYGAVITRDASTSPILLYAHPVTYNPSLKKLESLGIRETVDVTVIIPMLELYDAGLLPTRDDGTIDWENDLVDATTQQMIIGTVQYRIKTKRPTHNIKDSYINTTFALLRT